MSRCVLDNEDRNIEVVIGWDPGANSFFTRVFDKKAAIHARKQGANYLVIEEAQLILWAVGFDRKYTSSSELLLLIEAIQPYAALRVF